LDNFRGLWSTLHRIAQTDNLIDAPVSYIRLDDFEGEVISMHIRDDSYSHTMLLIQPGLRLH
jgi:hypothetical protein